MFERLGGLSIYIKSEKDGPETYRPGLDRWTLYKSIWQKFWPEFQEIYSAKYAQKYGKLRPGKIAEVQKLIGCGDFSRGFVRYQCHDCQTQLILPFSCKSRLCLSCYRKKIFAWSVNLSQILNPALKHQHVTFTLPGRLRKVLFERNFRAEDLSKLAALIYQREIRKLKELGPEWKAGLLTTVHKCGNGLNFNPHVHMISSRDLVYMETGEIREINFLHYRAFFIQWREIVLRHLVRKKILSKSESASFRKQYRKGFHCYFQPINGNEDKVLFRTAQYLASGFFHNSQIMKVDHKKKTITFRYRSWMETGSRKKHFSTLRLSVFEFMARMLYYLPDHHQKAIRYHGLYAASYRKRKIEIDRDNCSWSAGIANSFECKPEFCPDCEKPMLATVVFPHQVRWLMKKIRTEYRLEDGYFRPIRPP